MYTLDELKQYVRHCNKCPLCKERNNVVFGQGNESADILFIGEGPGYHEDMQGIAFVGPAGKLLTKALEQINITRDDVYIANIVKCRPPNNRNPLKEEMNACIEYLRYQVKLIKPKIIVCLGSIASKNIIDEDFKITKERGRWILKKDIWILPTFHPAAVLRDVNKEKSFFDDFEEIKSKYEGMKACGGA
ncbi:MAG: uracil-DNA glycosylase [Clostridia bacterium]|nr:uracil-DNA glycosylase [Clostridia bacterium]